jgi:hypothetical protein
MLRSAAEGFLEIARLVRGLDEALELLLGV